MTFSWPYGFMFYFSFVIFSSTRAFYPKVYVLLEGYDEAGDPGPPGSSLKSSTVSLVVFGNYSIVVDAATSNRAYDLMIMLSDRYGINATNVSLLIITHTHPDHYQNALMFHPAPQVVYKHEIVKDRFLRTPLQDSPAWSSPLGINELTILSTPGHTSTDLSLIVRNFNNTGKSLAIVGDLFLDADDDERSENGTGDERWLGRSDAPDSQRYFRKFIGCQVEFIIPGHGPMFPVTEEMRNLTLDCYSGQAGIRTTALFLFYFPLNLFLFVLLQGDVFNLFKATV